MLFHQHPTVPPLRQINGGFILICLQEKASGALWGDQIRAFLHSVQGKIREWKQPSEFTALEKFEPGTSQMLFVASMLYQLDIHVNHSKQWLILQWWFTFLSYGVFALLWHPTWSIILGGSIHMMPCYNYVPIIFPSSSEHSFPNLLLSNLLEWCNALLCCLEIEVLIFRGLCIGSTLLPSAPFDCNFLCCIITSLKKVFAIEL